MNNIVTPETANALKAAGFPQTEFETGQFWYGESKLPTLISKNFGEGEFICHYIGSGKSQRKRLSSTMLSEHDVFAPTATDIMKALGQKYVLWYDDSPKMQMWFCAKTADLLSEAQPPFGHTSPAEAAALAFLDKNKAPK